MSDEFGHIFGSVAGSHIDAWGAGPFVLTVRDKVYRFEDSDRFGPALIKKNGDPLKNPWPPERDPFWKAHLAWRRQGRRMEADRTTCIFDPLTPTTYYRKSPRSKEIIIVQDGTDEDAFIEVPAP